MNRDPICAPYRHRFGKSEAIETPVSSKEAARKVILRLNDVQQLLCAAERFGARPPRQFLFGQNIEVLQCDGPIPLQVLTQIVQFGSPLVPSSRTQLTHDTQTGAYGPAKRLEAIGRSSCFKELQVA